MISSIMQGVAKKLGFLQTGDNSLRKGKPCHRLVDSSNVPCSPLSPWRLPALRLPPASAASCGWDQTALPLRSPSLPEAGRKLMWALSPWGWRNLRQLEAEWH